MKPTLALPFLAAAFISTATADHHKALEKIVSPGTEVVKLGGDMKFTEGPVWIPSITKGPYAGEIATGDHIIPRSVCPELDNALFNLEFMPLTLNQKKAAKVTQRQIDLARRWHKLGILSEEGLEAVLRTSR